ncbi:MAG: translesion DNA synthesis-associated protein ImuA [Chromatiaceae bacterium]|nr:translesion DNA synthesis-associated protein ImuA [Gammaproteobacteria bacterium]MCP5313015.1 translesion DNA synthesis-associated protein ImuA [Chromatiaceae bacterium]
MQVIDLEELKSRGVLWQGQRGTLAPERVLATGWGVLDELLGGGWPRAALIEVLSEAHQGLALWLPLLARLSADPRWLVWVAPPYLPYAPALAARGVRVERVLLVRDVASPQALWAVEQALKSGACGLVLAWPESLPGASLQTAQLRRLQLAAEQGDCPGVLFRPLRAAAQGSPATLRLRLRPAPLGLEVEILKRRGGWGGTSCIVPIPSAGDPLQA